MSDPTPRPAGPERDDAASRGRALLGSFTRRDTTGLVVFTVGTFLTVSVAWSLVAGAPDSAADVNASTALVLGLTSAVGAWPLLLTGVAALAVGAGLFLTTRAAEAGKLAIALALLLPALAFLSAGLGGSGGALAGVLAGAEAGLAVRIASLALGAILFCATAYAFTAALGKAPEWKQVLAARVAAAGSRRRNPDEGRTGRQDGDRAEETAGARSTHGTSTEQVPGADAAGPRAIGAADPSGRRRAGAYLAADAATAVRGAEPRPLGGTARSEDGAAAALIDPAPVPRALEEADEAASHRPRPFGGVAIAEPGAELEAEAEHANEESEADAPEARVEPAAGVRPYPSIAGAAAAEPETDEVLEDEEDLEADEDEELESEEDEDLDAEEEDELEAEEDEELDAEEDDELEAEEDEELEAEDDEELAAEEAEEALAAENETEPVEAVAEPELAPVAEAETAPADAPQPGLFADDDVEDGVGATAVAPEPPAPAKRARKAPAADPVAEAIEDASEPEVVVDPASPRPRTRNERRKAARRAAQVAAAPPPSADPDAIVYEAGNLFLGEGRVAVSMLQKHWGLDFDQATAILDRLQELGLIGPYLGGKPREILLTEDEWRAAATEQA